MVTCGPMNERSFAFEEIKYSVTRYDCGGYPDDPGMEESRDGTYVTYDDYETAMVVLQKAKDLLEQQRSVGHGEFWTARELHGELFAVMDTLLSPPRST